MARIASSTLSLVTTPARLDNHDVDDQRCAFSRTREIWTLQADCEITAPLEISPNTTLEGHGHTITLRGDAERFGSAAIRASGGEIINLAVDGSALMRSTPDYFASIALAAPGRMSNVAVRNIRFDNSLHSAIGVEIAAFGFASTQLQDITLENISGVGLLLTGDGRIAAERVSSSDVTIAVQVGGTIDAVLTHAAIEGSEVDVLAQDQSRVRINESRATGVRIAENDALVHEATVTFIGAGNRNTPAKHAAVGSGMTHPR